MAPAAPSPTLRGPTLIRLLARLAGLDVAAPGTPLPQQLGQWLDWNHALALASALDGSPSATATAATPDELAAQCAQARATLAASIVDEPLLAPGAPLPAHPGDAVDAMHQFCRGRQRAMQTAAGRLRGPVRDALAQASPGQARLAEVDAALDAALTPREHHLLARWPELLAPRISRLLADAPADTQALDGMRRDLRDALLAELDLRFQPIGALLAALRPA
jgi:hypothetical protein